MKSIYLFLKLTMLFLGVHVNKLLQFYKVKQEGPVHQTCCMLNCPCVSVSEANERDKSSVFGELQ